MTLYKCDGCGLISPDEKGNHISNHWFEVEVRDRKHVSSRGYYLVCRECMEAGKPVKGIKKIWQDIKSKFNIN